MKQESEPFFFRSGRNPQLPDTVMWNIIPLKRHFLVPKLSEFPPNNCEDGAWNVVKPEVLTDLPWMAWVTSCSCRVSFQVSISLYASAQIDHCSMNNAYRGESRWSKSWPTLPITHSSLSSAPTRKVYFEFNKDNGKIKAQLPHYYKCD